MTDLLLPSGACVGFSPDIWRWCLLKELGSSANSVKPLSFERAGMGKKNVPPAAKKYFPNPISMQ